MNGRDGYGPTEIPRAKNLDIEVLRAFAVISVVVAHSGALFPWGSAGVNWISQRFGLWAGVDLFFAISGFVIARGLHDQLTAALDSPSRTRVLLAFWLRRVHRILPSAVLWLTIGIVLTIVFNRYGSFGTVRGNVVDAVAAIVQFADIHYYQCLTLGIDTCGKTRVFGPYWSLSLEEKFYLVLPLAIIFLRSRFKTAMIVAIVVQVVLPRKLLGLAWFLRTDAFLLGVLIALEFGRSIHLQFRPTVLSNGKLWKYVPIVIFVAMLVVASPYQIVPNFTGVVALLAGILVWIASYGGGYIVGHGMIRSVLAWIGARSYAIYLIHMPVYYITRELWHRIEGPAAQFGGNDTIRFVVTAICLIIIAAELNYRFVERPFRRLGAQRSARIFPASASMVNANIG